MLRLSAIVLSFCFIAATASAQENSTRIDPTGDEFTFIRVQFDSMLQGWDGGGWAHDYPEAETNFLRGVTRLTKIHINAEPSVLRLDDDRIFEYPFLYLVEIGRDGGPNFTEKEVENLREYLLRGGFLLIDDFKGKAGWQVFRQAFQKNFSREPVDQTRPKSSCFPYLL